jgi:integrase
MWQYDDMPKLFRTHVRKVVNCGHIRWLVDGRVDGKRVRLFFKTKEAANDHAATMEAKKGGIGELLTGYTQFETSLIVTQLRRLPAIAELAPAIDAHLSRLAKKTTSKPLAEVITEFLEVKRLAGKRPRYLQSLKSSLNKFSRNVGDEAMSAVNREQIEAWLNTPGWAQTTRRGYLIDMRTLVAFAVSRGYLAGDPTEGIERPMLENTPPGILTPDDCKKLMEGVRRHDPGLLPYVATMLFAGIRPAEAARMTRQEVRAGLLEVTAEKSKTRQRRLVEILPNLAEWLKLGGEMPPNNPRHRLLAVRANLNIKWPHDCLRHSFASYHLAKFKSSDRTAHELGHASSQMLFSHYRELVTPAQAEEFFNIRPMPMKPTPQTPIESKEVA